MPRDNFSRDVIDRLARRVGMKCSNPDCRLPTAGPDASEGATNTGVAAHIAAASPGGARYDEAMTPEQRSAINNGIWLCQTHAKLIDDDELTYTPAVLQEWKSTAEAMAKVEAAGFVVGRRRSFADLEGKAPKLIAEMRQDLKKHALVREIVILSRKRMYHNVGKDKVVFMYFLQDYDDLGGAIDVMANYGAIFDVTIGAIPRYKMREDFVDYLVGR
ncbi:hypothetical protein RFM99_15770 [Mesorhizobium sp. VK4C]|uniref:hypothetical protein n=1 Tax=Mesorhizobium captivum TaxID=3072319 RepID=UPI002A23A7F6|nr:hypothetical protein [Mesorhizobium sp. VK4C]MDX8499877.1 hypothetical protein [Mesorhizobium sp. VK4C]